MGYATHVSPAWRERALSIVTSKGRLYTVRGKYHSLRVFTKDRAEVLLLCSVFGGGFYMQGVGYIWVVGKKKTLITILGEHYGETKVQVVVSTSDNSVG